jgi:small conductance mechanosensitive channel
MSRSLIYYVFFFIALIMVMRVLGVDFSAILAGAGVIGLAIGFGAQTMVRDFLAGFFLLFEDSVNVGDFITKGTISGTVEFIGIRRTLVRAFDGTLYTIPNGELTTFGNKNRDYMQAVVNVDLAYEQDAEKGLALAQKVADEWFQDRRDIALAQPKVQGLLTFGESGLTIRVVAKVLPLKQWEAERELRVRLKKEFDSQDVEIPFARRVVYLKKDETGGDQPAS